MIRKFIVAWNKGRGVRNAGHRCSFSRQMADRIEADYRSRGYHVASWEYGPDHNLPSREELQANGVPGLVAS